MRIYSNCKIKYYACFKAPKYLLHIRICLEISYSSLTYLISRFFLLYLSEVTFRNLVLCQVITFQSFLFKFISWESNWKFFKTAFVLPLRASVFSTLFYLNSFFYKFNLKAIILCYSLCKSINTFILCGVNICVIEE